MSELGCGGARNKIRGHQLRQLCLNILMGRRSPFCLGQLTHGRDPTLKDDACSARHVLREQADFGLALKSTRLEA